MAQGKQTSEERTPRRSFIANTWNNYVRPDTIPGYTMNLVLNETNLPRLWREPNKLVSSTRTLE